MFCIRLKPEENYFGSSGNSLAFPGSIWAAFRQMHKGSGKQTETAGRSTERAALRTSGHTENEGWGKSGLKRTRKVTAPGK